MKHAPTPWKTDAEYEHQTILDADGNLVADCCIVSIHKRISTKQCEANAAFIVKACNDHERLKDERDAALESAKVLRKANDRLVLERDALLEAMHNVRQAIEIDSPAYALAIITEAIALCKKKENKK